jgi:type I restriction enzyme S subunit
VDGGGGGVKAGWQSKSFEDCIEKVAYTTKIQRKDFLDAGAYPVVSQEDAFINGYWDGADDVFRVETPLVVFGDHTKLLKYIDFDFVLGADGVKLLPPKQFLVPKFFYYQLQTAQLDSLGYARHYKLLKELEIKYPDRSEQHRIVAILDEAFDGIATAKANAEKNLQNARALFESHLQSVFTERGEGWVETTLGTEIDLLVGFAFKSTQYSNGDEDIRLLRGDNIVQGSLRWEDVKKWPQGDTAAYDRYCLHEGDVVLAMDRPWVKAGLKHATISADDLPCLLVQRTACLRCKVNLDSRFLIYLVRSAAFIQHILGVQTGIGVPHISGQQIKDFAFARPSTADQERIAERLDALSSEVQTLESLYRQKLTALDDLKKSLMHQAFAGQL